MAMRLTENLSLTKIDATRNGIIKKTEKNNVKYKKGDVRSRIFQTSNTTKYWLMSYVLYF